MPTDRDLQDYQQGEKDKVPSCSEVSGVRSREKRYIQRQANRHTLQIPVVSDVSGTAMEELFRRLESLEARVTKDVEPADPSLKRVLNADTYRLRAREHMSSTYMNQITHKESKIAGIKLNSIDSLKVLEFLSELRLRSDSSGIVEEHAALVLPTLVEHPFVAGELSTLTRQQEDGESRATYEQLVTFLLKTYVTEDSLLTARQKLHAAKMIQGETVETFASRLRKVQVLFQGAVTEEAIKKTLLNGLSSQLQLFADRSAFSGLAFAQIVSSLSQTQIRLEQAGIGSSGDSAPNIFRRQTQRSSRAEPASVSFLENDLFTSQGSESSVNVLTAEDMRTWICAVCRHFGHAAWLCPSVSEEVRLQARDLRQQQIRRNNGKDPMNEFQSTYRLNTSNQLPYRPPAFISSNSGNGKGREDGRPLSQ
jgi:hypothetical protein